MRGYVPLPQFRAPGPLNFSSLNQGIDAVGQKLEQNRLLQQQKDIGTALNEGGYGGAADAAFGMGDLKTGLSLTQAESSAEDRDFNRNRLLAQDARSAASDARSRELHGLKMQEAKTGLRDKLVSRVSGIAQMIKAEADPSRKAQMVQSLINSNPRMGQELSKLGLDPANPDAAMDMIIAEAQGLTTPAKDKYQFTKYGVGNTSTGEIQPYAQGGEQADSAQAAISNLDRLKTAVNQLKKMSGLPSATGNIQGRSWVPNIWQSTADADAAIRNLKGKVATTALQAMRDASKTGGAVGNVSEAEWPILESMIANLDPLQGDQLFDQRLDELIKYVDNTKARISGAASPPPSGGPSNVDALKQKYGLE